MKKIKATQYSFNKQYKNMHYKQFKNDDNFHRGDIVYRKNIDNINDYDTSHPGIVSDVLGDGYYLIDFEGPTMEEIVNITDLISADKYDRIARKGYRPIAQAEETSSTIETIGDEISSATKRFMESSIGWDDEDYKPEWVDETSDNIFFVDCQKQDDGRYKIEVRAELDYNGLMDLAETLNTIIEDYDDSVYFEPVDDGILDAYIAPNDRIEGSQVVEAWFEDPQDYEPPVTDFEEDVWIDLDDVLIDVFYNEEYNFMDFDYVDQTFSFLDNTYELTGDNSDYRFTNYETVGDKDSIIEYLNDLIIDSKNFPDVPGRYIMHGECYLYFSVRGQIYEDKYSDDIELFKPDITFNGKKSREEFNVEIDKI